MTARAADISSMLQRNTTPAKARDAKRGKHVKRAAAGEPRGHHLVRLRTRRYWDTLRWLGRVLIATQPMRVATIVVLVTIGRAMQMAVFASIIWYFTAFEGGRTLDALGRTIDPRSGEVMTAAIGALAAMLVVATGLIYTSTQMSFRAGVAFAKHIVASVLATEGAWPTTPALTGDGTMSAQAYLLSLQRMRLFRPIQVLLALPRHLLLCVPAIGGMLWISAPAVGLLSILAIPSLVLNYRLSRSVVTRERELKGAPKLFKRKANEAQAALSNEAAQHADRPGIATALVESEENRLAFAKFANRIISPAKSELVGNIHAAVALAVIGAYFGYEAITGALPLSLVIGFFLLMRFAIAGLTGMTVALTGYARFYETIRSAFEYLTSPMPRVASVSGRLTLHAKGSGAPGADANEGDVEVGRGTPVAVISPAVLNRYTQYFFALALTQKARHGARRRLNAAALRCTAALTEPAGLAAWGISTIDPALLARKTDGTPLASFVPDARSFPKAADSELPAADSARFALVAALLATSDFIIIDSSLLAVLPPAERRAWIAAFNDRYIAVAYPLAGYRSTIAGETHAVVMDHEKAVAVVGSKNSAPAAKAVRKAARKREAQVEGEDGDELDEPFE